MGTRHGLRWLLPCILMSIASTATANVFVPYGKTFQVGSNPSAIVATDLDDNGFPDIITANTGVMTDPKNERPANDEISLLFGGPGLEFTPQTPLRADFAPYAIAVANIDAMKAPDLIVASFMSVRRRDISLFRNLGDKNFESYYFPVREDLLSYNRMNDGDQKPVFSKPGLTALQVADLNQDGFRDIIATGWSSDVLVFFPGMANKWFGEPKTIPAGPGPRDLKLADFDNDGKLDLAVVLYGSNEVGLWKGDGTGSFLPVTRFSTRGRLPTKLQVADMNCDGKPDIVVSHCHADDSIVIFYNDGNFSFSNSQEILLGPARNVLEHEIRDILVADFNNDSRPDIAAACFGSGEIAILMNHSSNSSVSQSFAREIYRRDDGKPRALCCSDFNRDGAVDIAVALWDSNSVCILMGEKANAPKMQQDRESKRKRPSKEE